MLVVVSIVSFLVHQYSLTYMKGVDMRVSRVILSLLFIIIFSSGAFAYNDEKKVKEKKVWIQKTEHNDSGIRPSSIAIRLSFSLLTREALSNQSLFALINLSLIMINVIENSMITVEKA